MIKLVVFDWNGTLLADNAALVAGVNAQLNMLKHPPITVRQYQEHFDVPVKKLFQGLGVPDAVLDLKSPQMAEMFHATYEPLAAKTRLRFGTRTVLHELTRLGLTKILLSNHTLEGIYLQLERLKITSDFDAVLANETLHAAYFTGKQSRLEQYLKDNGTKPTEAVMVGDTVEEVQIGKSLSIKSIAISGGANSRARLKAAQPDFIIPKLVDLVEIIQELNS